MSIIKKAIILLGALGFSLWTPTNKDIKESNPSKKNRVIEASATKERTHSRKW